MKNFIKAKKNLRFLTLLLIVSFVFCSCEFLQSTLSSSMANELQEEIGIASISSKVWYYNGISGEDMSEVSSKSSNNYYAQSLKIDFSKKVYLKSLSGNIEFIYKDKNADSVTKSFNSPQGKFINGGSAFLLDLSEVIKLFDSTAIPSGEGLINLKLSGFVCAEGNQKGRSLPAVEFKNIKINPLYNSTEIYFSTIGFSTSSKFEIPLNSEISLENGSYSLVGKDLSLNEYKFTVSLSDEKKSIFLTPEFSVKPNDQTLVNISLNGILPVGEGDSYTKDFKLTFIKNLVVLDNKKDDFYISNSLVASCADLSGDSKAAGDDGEMYDAPSDFTALYVANDSEYLYVALEGKFSLDWQNGLAFMISKDHSYSTYDEVGQNNFKIADTVSFGATNRKHGLPDFYLYHQPQNSKIAAWVEDASDAENLTYTEISSGIETGSSSWTSGTFAEYAIPISDLAKAGISTGDEIHLMAVFSAHWDAGIFAADVIPDDCVSLNSNHNSATFNFQKALSYTIQ